MNKLFKAAQFAIIATFIIVFAVFPENIAKPISAIVLAVFFLLLFAESVINKEGYLRLAVVKKSENKIKYYLVLLFHLTVTIVLVIYSLVNLLIRK